jgi:FkbM family methyltransferase
VALHRSRPGGSTSTSELIVNCQKPIDPWAVTTRQYWLVRPRSPALRTVAKVPYYTRSGFTLLRALEPGSRLPALISRPWVLRFRVGIELEVLDLLDLLVVKETVCDDVYRLADLATGDLRVIVDVGAGLGDFAVLAGSTFPAAEILAFEPNPESFAVLERNLLRNHLSKVEARCIAVGTRSSYELARTRWSATGTVHARRSTRAVPALALQEIIGDREVDFLKIDCEGSELEVLESLGGGLARVNRIAVEYHDHLVEAAGERVERLLRAEGFTVRREPDRHDRRIGYVHAARLQGRTPGGRHPLPSRDRRDP